MARQRLLDSVNGRERQASRERREVLREIAAIGMGEETTDCRARGE